LLEFGGELFQPVLTARDQDEVVIGGELSCKGGSDAA
jgi:hypothetical protein